MQIEIQGIPKSMKSTYSTRLKNAQSELTRYKKLSKDAHAQMSRSNLFSFSGTGAAGRMSTSDEPYADDRTRLLAGADVLDDGMRLVFILHFLLLPLSIATSLGFELVSEYPCTLHSNV